MRVESVHIRNFRAIGELKLQFADDVGAMRPVTVLAGPNGCGKTTTLFAIVQALRGVMGYRTSDVPAPTNDDIRSTRSPAGKYVTDPSEVTVKIELAFDSEEQVAIPELLKRLGKRKPPTLDDGRLCVRWQYPPVFDSDGSRRNWWNASVDPPEPGVRAWLHARKWAIQARDYAIRNEFLSRIGGIVFFPQDRNLVTRVVSETGGLSGVENSGGADDDGDDDEQMGRSAPRERSIAEILHYLSDYAKSRRPQLPDEQNWEQRIRRIFHQICAPKKYLGYAYRPDDLEHGVPLLQDGDDEYPVSHAASGEQIVLEYVTRLTFPSPHDRSVILIDEPEVHLHPAWVRKLYLALPHIGTANQYILTTHSGELRRRAASDNALRDLGDRRDAE